MTKEQTMEHSALLAQTLAQENINVVRAREKTASFDLKTRTLTIPVWDNMDADVERMLIEHEVGHALFTPENYGETITVRPSLRYALNVVEDVRIERKFKEQYPGSRNDFAIASKKLRETDFFEIADRDLTVLNLIDRMNLFFKLGAACGVKFGRDEVDFISRARTIETFEGSVALAESILEFMSSKREEQKEKEQQQDTGAGGESNADPAKNELPSDGADADDSESDESETSGSNTHSGEEDESTACSCEEDAYDKSSAESYRAETVDTYEQKLGEMTGTNSMDVQVTDIHGDAGLHKKLNACFVSHKEVLANVFALRTTAAHKQHLFDNQTPFKTTRSKITNQVNHLVSQFEMRQAAKMYALREPRRTGALDIDKIAQYRVRDDVFLTKTVVPEGKNHGMVMLLDWSGSMRTVGIDRKSMVQVIQLVMFCRRVGIPYRVFAFSENNKFEMLELFSDRQTKTEQQQMFVFACNDSIQRAFPMARTPLAHALVFLQDYLGKFKAEYKIDKLNLITFTDGVNSTSVAPLSEYRRTHYIQDPVTKKRYRIQDPEMRNRMQQRIAECNAYFSILRDRYNCKIISFFIHATTGNIAKTIYYSGCYDRAQAQEYNSKLYPGFSKKGFASYTGFGRDEIFLIKGDALATNELGARGVSNNMTAAEIARTLKMNAKSATTGKILVEKFVEAIA